MRGRLLTRYSPIRRSARQQAAVLARLACIRHSTSVRSEPGSNSSLFYKVCPGTLSLSVNVIDRSITQAHLQILQSACPDPVRGVSWPFPTGTRPIIEIPTESSRGSCADFCEFPRFFSYNACLPSKRRQKTAYFHIVHNQSTHFFLFRRHFFSIPPKMQSRRPLETAPGRPKAPPPPLMRFLAPISTAISTAMPSSTPFPQTGTSSAWSRLPSPVP